MTAHQTDDYEPVELAAFCNAGSDALAGGPPIAAGLRRLHGFPFLIERARDGDAARFIVVEPDGPDVVIPLGRPADHVIVAHRRLPGPAPEREPSTGDLVAEYVFDVEGAPAATAPIRERFEIGVAPRRWDWEAPFLAVLAGATEPLDRNRGAWDDAGLRQTEIPYRERRGEVFLWAWESPDPERVLASVRLRSRGSRILVAAITVGHAAEDPFGRDAALPLRISMTGPDRPCRADELNLTVDRGVSSYTYALPNADTGAYLSDPMKGWGEAADDGSRHAYARVAALPSATLTVAGRDGDLVRLRWRDVTAAGAAETGNVRVELVEPGRTWVHVRVVDDDSGRPVPCRVHFRSPEGIPYQPHGHHDHVNSDLGTWHVDVGGDVRLGRLTYAYIDGTCQGWLPTGEVLVDVARGFEYEPIRDSVRIARGQRELELRLKRCSSFNQRGWYSGDSHVHFLSSHGALLEQQGEDLNVVNLLQSQWGRLFTNTEDFTGRPLGAPSGPYVTYVSQENRQHVLGHLVLWGLREPVMPWCTDGPTEAELGGALETTLSDWADRCHDQGGTVVIPHFPSPNGEPATLIATGRADAVEMIVQRPRFHEEYYRYLNCGYRLPLVGGTDKMSSEVPVGLYRTYAKLGDEEFTYDAWRRAVVAGRTFLSGGPLLTFQVDGRDLGETVRIAGPGTVTVSAAAASVLPVSSLEVVQNGRVVAATSNERGRRLQLTTDIRVDGDCWLAARCGGPGYFDGPSHRDVWGRGIFAHTSPVYVATRAEWELFDPAHARYMLTLIDGSLEHIRRRARRYPRDSVTHHHGEDDHDAYLERPFLQARGLLERRLARSPGRR
jgi:hypothetical protein